MKKTDDFGVKSACPEKYTVNRKRRVDMGKFFILPNLKTILLFSCIAFIFVI